MEKLFFVFIIKQLFFINFIFILLEFLFKIFIRYAFGN